MVNVCCVRPVTVTSFICELNIKNIMLLCGDFKQKFVIPMKCQNVYLTSLNINATSFPEFQSQDRVLLLLLLQVRTEALKPALLYKFIKKSENKNLVSLGL